MLEKNKKNSLWHLTVRSDFSSAHALRNYQGKCENIHGHNYHVEMVIQGTKLSDDVELVVDFTVLKRILKEACDTLDHKDINTFPPFDKINPSAENIARYLYKYLEVRLEEELKSMPYADTIEIYSVSVSEKAAQTATYREF